MLEFLGYSAKRWAAWAVGFFVVSFLLSSAFAAYSALQTVGTASSWSSISSSEWNKMVSNFASVDSQLALLGPFVPVSGIDTVLRSTSSTSAATVTGGPTVTANIRSSGMALVTLTASMSNSTAGANCVMMVRATNGASTYNEHDWVAIRATSSVANATTQLSGTYLLTGLPVWSTTFTAYHKVSAWTCSLANRHIIVTPY